MVAVNDHQLQDAALVEMLTDGPIGIPRRWATALVLRMLETTGGYRYRADTRLGGAANAQAALASLRAAMAVLSQAEQGSWCGRRSWCHGNKYVGTRASVCGCPRSLRRWSRRSEPHSVRRLAKRWSSKGRTPGAGTKDNEDSGWLGVA